MTAASHDLASAGPRPRSTALPSAFDHPPLALRSVVDTTWLPPNAVWVAASEKGNLAAVGESNYQDALRLCLDCDDYGAFAVAATLHTEPENPYDPQAVVVRVRTGTAGYLPRTKLPVWRPIVLAHEEAGHVPTTTAAIIGGGWNHDEDQEHFYGIWLHVDSNVGRQRKAVTSSIAVARRA